MSFSLVTNSPSSMQGEILQEERIIVVVAHAWVYEFLQLKCKTKTRYLAIADYIYIASQLF